MARSAAEAEMNDALRALERVPADGELTESLEALRLDPSLLDTFYLVPEFAPIRTSAEFQKPFRSFVSSRTK
jgi:hypothetical protein